MRDDLASDHRLAHAVGERCLTGSKRREFERAEIAEPVAGACQPKALRTVRGQQLSWISMTDECGVIHHLTITHRGCDV